MDPNEVYDLLNLIQKGIFWSFFTVNPTVLVMVFIVGRWLHFSLISFDDRHRLSNTIPNVSAKGKKHEWEISYAKFCILNALARYYIKPHWTRIRRNKNKVLIEEYKTIADPYFLACHKLLDENLIYKKRELVLNKRANIDVNYSIKEKELIRFLNVDRYISAAKWGCILLLLAFISYKIIIPNLLNYYETLMWGF